MTGRYEDRSQQGQTPDVPGAILAFVAAIDGLSGYTVDAPSDPAGEWWIDLTIDGSTSEVAWRPEMGFGIYTSEDCTYGSGPDEIILDPEDAARRLGELMRLAGRGSSPDTSA